MQSATQRYRFGAGISLLVLLLTSIFPSNAQQSQDFLVRNYAEDDGLTNHITSLLPDGQGFVWVGTQNGLKRFDGHRFYEPAYGPEIKGYPWRIFRLYAYSKDTLLALGRVNQVFVIAHGRIVGDVPWDPLKHGVLLSNGARRLMVKAAYSAGSEIREFVMPKELNGVSGVSFGSHDSFVIFRSGHLDFLNRQGRFNSIYVPGLVPERTLHSNGRLIHFSKEGQVEVYSAKGLESAGPSPFGKEPLTVWKTPFSSAFGYLCHDSVLYRLSVNPASGLVSYQAILSNLQYSADITTVWEKDSSTILVGTLSKGLFVYTRRLFRAMLPPANKQNFICYAQLVMPDGRTIVSGRNYQFRDGQFMGRIPALEHANQYHFLQDRKGQYWYQIDDLFRTSLPGAAAQRVVPLPKSCRGPYADREGRIWYGEGDVNGPICYLENDQLHRVVRNPKIDHGYVECFDEDAEGNMRVGTSTGIYTLKRGQDGQFEIKDGVQLPGVDVRFIRTDASGNTWIASYGNGLHLLRKDGKLLRMPADAENRLAQVHAAISDGRGNLWLPTNHGLLMTSQDALINYTKGGDIPYYFLFGKGDGLETNELNSACPTHVWTRDSLLSLPSMNGLVQFYPAQLPVEPGNSKIVLDYVLVDGKLAAYKESFSLPAGAQHLSLHVSSPTWGPRLLNDFRYQLIEKDKQTEAGKWLDVPENGTISFTKLRAGDYHIVILKKAPGTASGEQTLGVSLKVMPPWYQTPWAYVFWALCGAGLITIFYVYRLRRARQKNHFEKMLLEEQLKAMRAQLDPHFIQNTFSLVGNRIAAGRKDEALDSLSQVSRYFRQMLYRVDTSIVSLEEELDFAREYLAMMQLVYEHSFRYTIDVSEEVDSFGMQVPTLVLQPFLENAVKYGISEHGAGGEELIQLAVVNRDPYVVCTITDPSGGMQPGDKPSGYISRGRALSIQRLEKLFAKRRYKPKVTSEKMGNGYVVSVYLPMA